MANEDKKMFMVYVEERRVVRYLVEATDADDAREAVEASTDADEDFGFKTIETYWSVEDIVES